jgi:hypothetical protein
MTSPVGAQLERVRRVPRYQWLAMVAGCAVGLVLASIHWVGLVAGGALVGLVATTLPRALLAGLGFGVLVVLTWVGGLLWAGSLGNVTAMGQIAGIGLAMAIVGPLLGSLVRGVV